MHPPEDNIGSMCLATLASTWQVDKTDVNWVDNGFDWCPGSHLVQVRALRGAAAEDRWRISVETNLLTSIPLEDPNFVASTAAVCGITTSTYSMHYPPAELWRHMPQEERPKLSLFSSIYVDRELLGWLPTFLAHEAIIQVINAEKLCDRLSEKLGGEPDLKCKERKSPDEILAVLDTIYVPEGRNPSRWSRAGEFIEFAEEYGKTDVCFGTGDETGLTLETPFGEDSALIRLRSDVPHPQLGSGLLATIQIPFQFKAAEVEKTSAFLNFFEARQWTDIPQLGCWHPHEIADGRMGLAHASFVPNVLYKDGLATNFAIWSLGRVRWVRQELWPKLQDKPMLEILTSRMEALAKAADKGKKKPN